MNKNDIPSNKHLGSLCKRGHDWEGTGKSLRRKLSYNCIECEKERWKTPEYQQKKQSYREKNRAAINIKRNNYRKTVESKREGYLEQKREDNRKYKKGTSGKAAYKRQSKRSCTELRDSYIKGLLARQINTTRKCIPVLLVEAKRAELKLYRSIREARHAEE